MIIEIIILGIIQGLTEFLPISSSGHLVILEKIFHMEEPVGVIAFLHLGTFLATIIFFRKDLYGIITGLIKKEPTMINYVINIIVGNIPIVLFAISFKDMIEKTFTDLSAVMVFLGMTGALLLLTSIVPKGDKEPSLLSALLIGIGQMFAIFPGLSRSGLTISTGIFIQVNPDEAFRFSFLLSLPAVFGANLFKFKDITNFLNPLELFIGLTISLISGYIALKLLRALVKKWFHLFGFYCLFISVVLLFTIYH